MRNALHRMALVTLLAILGTPVVAQEVTLRIHHFLSQAAPLHANMLVPFKERIETASGGRLEVQLFPSMSLGGRPGDLYDQAVDGAVDAVLTLPGYTAGRFNRTEVFELPFLMEDAIATSKAFWDLIETDLQDTDFRELRILSGWVHGPGVIHSTTPITSLEDMVGKELRGPTRLATDLLAELGAIPVGMPLPAIPENLSRGVINGTLLPWEVTPSIRLAELLGYHTELDGERALYTATFILAMNQEVYDALPDELRDLLNQETGKTMAEFAAGVMLEADEVGRQMAQSNEITTLGREEVARWVAASEPVYQRWINRAQEAGFDGEAAIARARDLIEENQ